MNPFLNTAFKAARKAGQMMIRAAGNLDAVKVDSKAFNDFVSDVDRSSEMILVEALKEAYPHHKITCEEGGSHGKATAEYEWIIDPLDGTTISSWHANTTAETKFKTCAASILKTR